MFKIGFYLDVIVYEFLSDGAARFIGGCPVGHSQLRRLPFGTEKEPVGVGVELMGIDELAESGPVVVWIGNRCFGRC